MPQKFESLAAPAPTGRRHRPWRVVLGALTAGTLLAVATAQVNAHAAAGDPSSPSASPTVSPTASADPTDKILGDRRTVTEPKLPATICATVTAGLNLTGRLGTDAQETAPPDTARVQAAIDSCLQSGAGSVGVKLVADAATGFHDFLVGPLVLKKGVVLVVDSPVTVYGARNAASYQKQGATGVCGQIMAAKDGCVPLISGSGANMGVMGVRAADGRQGTIDARGDAAILGQNVTWWQNARAAENTPNTQNNPRLLVVSGDNFTLYDITLMNPAQFTVSYQNGSGFTAWGVKIKTPNTARNTDGIDPSGATDVTIRDSWISTGDDCIAIKGAKTSSHITIRNLHCYGTHGISVGSETNGGVNSVLVQNVTIDGKDAFGGQSREAWGIRIKSNVTRGGLVNRIGYTGVCIRNSMGPMVFDTHYNNGVGYFDGPGTLIPVFNQITVKGIVAVDSLPDAYNTFNGFDSARPLEMTIQDASIDAKVGHAEHARLTIIHSNLRVTGTDVVQTVRPSGKSLPRCSFEPFPAA